MIAIAMVSPRGSFKRSPVTDMVVAVTSPATETATVLNAPIPLDAIAPPHTRLLLSPLLCTSETKDIIQTGRWKEVGVFLCGDIIEINAANIAPRIIF